MLHTQKKHPLDIIRISLHCHKNQDKKSKDSQFNDDLHSGTMLKCSVKLCGSMLRSRVLLMGQRENLTRCLVAVKPPQSSGSCPWQRSAGSYSNLSVKNIITQSAFARRVAENASTRRQTHVQAPLSLCDIGGPMSQPQECRFKARCTLYDINTGCCAETHLVGLRPLRSYNPC